MWSLIKSYPKAVAWAVIVNVVFLVVMGVSFRFIDAPSVSVPDVQVVKAVLKDDSIARKQELQKLKKEREKRERQKKLKLEKKRKAELKKKKLAKLQAQKKLEKQRALKKKQIEEENQRQLEAENKRIEQEKERKRREDQLKKELELEQQRLSAERKARNATIISKQLAIIKSHIEQRWIKPASAKPGMVCVVKISLIPSGEVINIQYIKRSGNAAFDQSVYSAVKRSSPLPLPPVEYGLSDQFRQIELKFGTDK